MKTNNFGILCLGMMLCLAVVSCGDKDNDNSIEFPKVDFVTRDKVEIQVPNEGGEYTVRVDLQGKLYLKENDVVLEDYSYNLYEKEGDNPLVENKVKSEQTLVGNLLQVKVERLNATIDCSKDIRICNEEKQVVVVVRLVQNGRMMDFPEIPRLGDMGTRVMNNVATKMAEALANVSILETRTLKNNSLKPSDEWVNDAWACFAQVDNELLSIKYYDSRMLKVYDSYCDVLHAICYYEWTQFWGDVPYFKSFKEETVAEDWKRIPQSEILKDLKMKLLSAIDKLEEKKNCSFDDVNGFFFVSKDVARFVLAHIYMLEGCYVEAIPLLEKIITNGFYKLDDVIKDSRSTDIIFGLMQQEGNYVIEYPWFSYRPSALIPYATLTDVYLSLAECYYRSSGESKAQEYLQQVMSVQNTSINETEFMKQLSILHEENGVHSVGIFGKYFSFLKRNGLVEDVCGVEEYRLLFPVPETYMKEYKGVATQNPGY